MKHNQIIQRLLEEAKTDPNTLALLVFGSVALGTHNEKSDVDLIVILIDYAPSSGIENKMIDGIKVGTIFFTYEVLADSVEEVPYLLHILGNAKLLFDREKTIEPLLRRISDYFAQNPEMVKDWEKYYKLLVEEKKQFGYEKTTIIDVWNELESRYSGGEIKRTFFRAI
jgi:predicted nucleotidyltransferase